MIKNIPTKQAAALITALENRGLKVEAEHWDGHKTVDIYLPEASLYIEVDGLQHYTEPKQFMADLLRDHYSDDDKFLTKHISNQLIETHLEEIADAVTQVAKLRQIELSPRV